MSGIVGIVNPLDALSDAEVAARNAASESMEK
jgi:hypothetical protein